MNSQKTTENNLNNIMFLLHRVIHHYLLIFLLVIVSMGAAIFEGFGITLVFPFLQGFTDTANIGIPPPFNKIFYFFSGMALPERLQLIAIILILVTVIKSALIFISVCLTNYLRILIIKYFRMESVKQIMQVGIGYFNKQRISDFHFIFESCTESSAGTIVNLIGTALPQVFTVLLLLFFLFLLSFKLTLLSIVLVLIVSFSLGHVTHLVSKGGQKVIDSRYNFNRILFDIFNGMKLIRLFNRENYIINKFQSSVEGYNKNTSMVVKLSSSVPLIFETLGVTIFSIILIVGSFIMSEDKGIWLGILATFIIILARIINPAKSLVQIRTNIIEKLPAVSELRHFLSPQNKLYISNGKKVFTGFKKGIIFQNVTFSYNKETVVLYNVSFSIPKGIKLGIVGRSGSGKSTIIELLLRFYDPQEGRIFIDDVDLRDLDFNSWRRHIGVVSQDAFLFNDTIKFNIAFAKEDAREEEIEIAARRAHIHEFISTLPNGYNTFIGERGVLLSGGQIQRICIARAILTQPEILIFDEATSSLDTESEKIVQEALNEIGRGKTAITIAHRFSTVSNSDKIIVIEEGRIIEQGSHLYLMQNSSLYKRLVEIQRIE